MTKALPNFVSIEFKYNGMKSLASPSNVSMDGVGKKRAFNHKITSDETGLVVQSDIAGVPLLLEHSQVSCSYYCLSFTFSLHYLINFISPLVLKIQKE